MSELTDRRVDAVVAAARTKARELGVPAVIAVLDAGAHLKGFVRMDGAPLGSVDIAERKARTAVLFGIASEAVWEYCRPGAPAPGLEHTNGGLAPYGGGLPLKVDGIVVGALGVSGGAITQDLEIARAGAAAADGSVP